MILVYRQNYASINNDQTSDNTILMLDAGASACAGDNACADASARACAETATIMRWNL